MGDGGGQVAAGCRVGQPTWHGPTGMGVGGSRCLNAAPVLLCEIWRRYLQPVATMQRRRPSSFACVEELGNLSSPWLPGYKIICHVFPEKGAWLGRCGRQCVCVCGEQQGRRREIVSAVGINGHLRSYHSPIPITPDSPTAQLPSQSPGPLGLF